MGRSLLNRSGMATAGVPHLDLYGASKGHAELRVVVLGEDPLEGLLEEGRVERVAHHNVAPVDTHTHTQHKCYQ